MWVLSVYISTAYDVRERVVPKKDVVLFQKGGVIFSDQSDVHSTNTSLVIAENRNIESNLSEKLT